MSSSDLFGADPWLDGAGADLFDQLFPGAALSGDGAHLSLSPAGSGPAAAAPRLRCVDPSHAAGCTLCTRPPCEEEEGDYLLRSGSVSSEATTTSADGRTGTSALKQLRSHLLNSVEWHSQATRQETARAEEAAGDPSGLARLLLDKKGSTLRKEHLLRMCRAWGYASNLWQLRGDFARKRRRPAGAQAAYPPVQVPRPLAVVESISVPVGGDLSVLRTLWEPSADYFLGSICRTECLRRGVAFYNDTIAAEYATFDISTRLVVDQISSLTSAQARWNASVSERIAAECGTTALRERMPALLIATYTPDGLLPAEEAVQSFMRAHALFQVAWRARRASAQDAMASGGGPRLAMEPISAEMNSLYSSTSRYLTEALLILIFTRSRCSAEEYMAASPAVLHEAALFVAALRRNIADQSEWYAGRIAEGRMRPLPTQVADHGFKEIWGGVAQSCQQLREGEPARSGVPAAAGDTGGSAAQRAATSKIFGFWNSHDNITPSAEPSQ